MLPYPKGLPTPLRLFVAIEIASEIRARIDEFVLRIKDLIPDARWSHPEGLHITVKFLGNVNDEKNESIQEALRSVSAKAFPLSFQGIGVFPNAKSPRVLWVGIEASNALQHLADHVDGVLSPIGFQREQRAFTPHVTLARFAERRKTPKLNFIVESERVSFGTMFAKEFHLYQSKLSPQGSHYAKLATFSLQ